MAQKIKDPIYTAIETHDANGVRRLAAAARNPDQRMLLLLLAEFIEGPVQNIRRMRRFPFIGIEARR